MKIAGGNDLIFFIRTWLVFIFVFIVFSFPLPSNAKSLQIIAEPSSGIAPLEVKLHCKSPESARMPDSFTIDYGDGSPPETVEKEAYSHVFTHTYRAGVFSPSLTVTKQVGLNKDSDPETIVVAKWRFDTRGEIDSSPAIGKYGKIYVGSDDGNLYAIDPDTGTEIWRFETGASIQAAPAIGDDGTIYIGSLDGNLYALSPSGRLKWKYALGKNIFTTPAIDEAGTLYVGGSDGVYALTSSGSEKWFFPSNGKVISSPVIGFDGLYKIVYFGSTGNRVYAVRALNGKEKWQIETNAAVYSSPAIGSDGRIYVGECEVNSAEDYDFNFYSINLDGTVRWEFFVGTGVYGSPVIGEKDVIYVGSWDGVLYGLDEGGAEKWSYEASADFNSSPAVGSNGIVYTGNKDGNFYAIDFTKENESYSKDQEDKRIIWQFETGNDIIQSSPAIGEDGTIYFGSRDGSLYAINPGDTALAKSRWPMYRRGPQHQGRATNANIPLVISTIPSQVGNVKTTLSSIKVRFSYDVKADFIELDSFELKELKADRSSAKVIEGKRSLDWNKDYLTAILTIDESIELKHGTLYSASIEFTDKNGESKKKEWNFATELSPEENPDSSTEPEFCFIGSMLSFN